MSVLKRRFTVPFASAARAAGSAQTSTGVDSSFYGRATLVVNLTAIGGTPDATALDVKIQYSPDTTGSLWIDLPNGAITQLTATGTNVVFDKPITGARRVRVSYTLAFTNGTAPTATFAIYLALSQV
jgi:hypothetical protein